jgi:hypothetical protein
MKNLVWLGALAFLTCGSFLAASTASAQCATCPTPVVAYSPVVYNNYQVDEGWYPGKLIGRLGQRLFGTAPAPAYANYTAAYPMTYGAAYAPTYAAAYAPTYAAAYAPTYTTAYAPAYAAAAPTYATNYAPAACTSCGVNPCSCQTSYRPVVMQPVVEQTTYYSQGCATCGTATGTAYSAAPAPGCANCAANYAEQAIHQAPVAAGVAPSTAVSPPQTFREPELRNEPTPASGTSASEATKNWEPPQLFAPGDKQVKRPSTTVWTAVYEQPVAAKRPTTRAASVSQGTAAPAKQQPTVTWVAVE